MPSYFVSYTYKSQSGRLQFSNTSLMLNVDRSKLRDYDVVKRAIINQLRGESDQPAPGSLQILNMQSYSPDNPLANNSYIIKFLRNDGTTGQFTVHNLPSLSYYHRVQYAERVLRTHSVEASSPCIIWFTRV